MLIGIVFILSIILINQIFEPPESKPIFDKTFITEKQHLMQKFDEGYNEVCLQDYFDGNKKRACLLDKSWSLVDIPESDQYGNEIPSRFIGMESKSTCTYREFIEPYEDFGLFFDAKIHAEKRGLPSCNSVEPYTLKWEHRYWKITIVEEGFFIHFNDAQWKSDFPSEDY